jgi:hypothetical protein
MMCVCVLAWLGAVAEAADLSLFSGDWGVDPTRSDDPTDALSGVIVGTTMGTEAQAYSPDGGKSGSEDEGDATRDRLLADVYSLLGASGRIGLRPADAETVDVALSGEESVRLELNGGWARIERSDGETCRIRARDAGDKLVLERRLRSTRLFETLVPPDTEGLLVAVVRIEGSVIDHGIEFRRVYRGLIDGPAASPAGPAAGR